MAWGSFLNVVVDRLKQGGLSLIYPPSHCDSCKAILTPWELIPLISYIFLGGKCHRCGSPIHIRVALMELSTGLILAFLYFNFGAGMKLFSYIFYISIFSIIFVTDLEDQIIPNVLLLISIPISFIISVFVLDVGWVRSLLGGGLAFVLLLIPYLLYSGGMGAGDVKLAGLMGLSLGFPNVLVSLFLAIISGGILALFLLLFKIKERKAAIPFGPFLSLSAMASLIWGSKLWNVYLNLISWQK